MAAIFEDLRVARATALATVVLLASIPTACQRAGTSATGEGDGAASGTGGIEAPAITGSDGTAMIEIDYRYSELYFAATGSNWEYAYYQLVKLREAMDRQLAIHPTWKPTAEAFFTPAVDRIEESLKTFNAEKIPQDFYELRMGCNGCHAVEGALMINVQIPQAQRSTVTRH